MEYMDARHRMSDVTKLRSNACQDFLKLIVRPDWKDDLYKKAKRIVEGGGPKNIYYENYAKMREMGIEEYSIDNMDVSFIYEILLHCTSLLKDNLDDEVRKAYKDIKNDRNGVDHSDENEDMKELYLRELISLLNLKNFVRTVNLRGVSIDDSLRAAYGKEYVGKINDLMDIIDEERIELIQKKKEIQKDINRILEREDRLKAWVETREIYEAKRRYGDGFGEYSLFINMASEQGVSEAHYQAVLINLMNKDEKRAYEAFDRLIDSALSSDCHRHNIEDIVHKINEKIERYGNELPENEQNRIDEYIRRIRERGIMLSKEKNGKYVLDEKA